MFKNVFVVVTMLLLGACTSSMAAPGSACQCHEQCRCMDKQCTCEDCECECCQCHVKGAAGAKHGHMCLKGEKPAK